MKRFLALLSCLPASLLADPADDYVNFIHQIQQDSGLVWDVTVPPDGVQVSPTGVSEDGSFFQLWSIHNETVTEYLLDEQFVTAYTPNASLEIISLDPYGPRRRTRVDQPFQLKVTVTGLIDPADPVYDTAPDAAKWVDYTHVGFLYPDGIRSLEEIDNPVGQVVDEGWTDENVQTAVTFQVSNLTGPDLTKVAGEEVFTISAQADFGVSATVLASERIQIWPIAQGAITGVDPTAYYDLVPTVSVNLTDLYPASTTYLRFYSMEDPSAITNVNESYVVIEDSIPQDRTIVLGDLDKHFSKEGYHVLELVHETPFGAEILDAVTIRVDRTISVRSNLHAKG